MPADLQTLAPSIAESQAMAARSCPMCRRLIGHHEYREILACMNVAAEKSAARKEAA